MELIFDRNGTIYRDPLVKVFDLRNNRSLPPVSFPPGAFVLKHHPLLSSTMVVASEEGVFQLAEAGGSIPPASMNFYQVEDSMSKRHFCSEK